ncbi:MAG: hypothetical protein EBS85_05310 [Micrococcales bacterium]|nr:hypothetical protein [Micrococcales bacterium]
MSEQETTPDLTGQDEITSAAEKTSLLKKFKKSSKRTKLIVAGVTSVVLVSGGVSAYAVYQSPDTVIAQAIVSLVTTSNPSFEMDFSGNTSGVDATLQMFTAGATLNVVADKTGDIYLNLANFSTLASALEQTGLAPNSMIQAYSSALTDKWVKVSETDLNQATASLGQTSSCLNKEAIAQVATDLQNSLRNNFFVKAKEELPQEDGNRVFPLTLDAGKVKGFATSFRDSKGFAELAKCQPGLALSDASINSITQQAIDEAITKSGSSFKLYANAVSHNFAKLSIDINTGGQKINFTLKANGSHPEKVVIPSESETFTEFLTAMYSGFSAVGTY